MPVALPLVELGVLALVLWVLATALAIALVMNKVGDVFKGIPVVGGAIAGAVKSVAQAITAAAGALENGVDRLIGASWHLLSRFADVLWNQIASQAHLLAQIAELLGGQLAHVTGLSSLVHRLERAFHGIEHGIKTLTREWHGIDRRVSKIEHEIARGIGHDLRITVAGLKTEVTDLEKNVIPGLRQGIKVAEGEVTTLENFIDAIPGTKYLDWAAGVVAAGLGLSLFNLFKCPTFLNKTLGRGCGLWNGIEDIFSLFLDAVLFIDLCKIVPEATRLFSEFEAPLVDLISGAANAACAQIPADWVIPMVAAGPRPPAQTLGTFPPG